MQGNPWLAPIFLPGTEPQLKSYSPEEREQLKQMEYWSKIGGDMMLYCPVKVALAGTMGEYLPYRLGLSSLYDGESRPIKAANEQVSVSVVSSH